MRTKGFNINFQQELTNSSSISSSSSGTCGGLKKLKKLSHFSVFVIGLAFFDPFFGFFFRIFCVKHFPGSQSMSVLQSAKITKSLMGWHVKICINRHGNFGTFYLWMGQLKLCIISNEPDIKWKFKKKSFKKNVPNGQTPSRVNV